MFATLRVCLRIAVIAFVMMANIEIGQAAGALAIGECGAYGYARDYPQSSPAVAAALNRCTGACKAVQVSRSCAALAVDVRNACGSYGYAVNKRLGDAQNEALRHCYRYGGKDCVIRAWMCDGKG